MKRAVCSLLIIFYLACLLSASVAARPDDEKEFLSDEVIVKRFDDGSTLTSRIEVKTSPNRLVRAGDRTYTYYSAFGIVLWELTLDATFTYTGIVAVCTSSSLSFTAYDNDWSASYLYASRNGDTAYGDFTVQHTVLGIVIRSLSGQMTLTCDPNGNLS